MSSLKLNNVRLFKSEFSKNVATLISGVALAQMIPFLLSPILSRIYTLEDFGEYAIFNSFIGVLLVISTARFEYAIALPQNNIDGLRLLKLIFLLASSVALIVLVLVFAFRKLITHTFGMHQNSYWLYLIPATLIIVSTYQGLMFWYNRKKDFKLQALGKLSTSVGQSPLSIILGIANFGSLGLILSYIFGQVIGIIPFSLKLTNNERTTLIKTEFKELTGVAKTYKKFPTFLTIGSLLNSFSTQLPILMITGLFSTEIVGAMSFAQTMVVVPTGLISTAFSDALRQRAVAEYQNVGTCRPLLMRTVKKLFVLGILPFAALYFLAPSLFTLFFGKEWEIAGEFAQLMTLMFFFRFVFMSISGTIIIISERLEYDIVWQAGYLISVFLSIYLGNHFFADVKKIILTMTLVSSVFYLISFLMAYKFSVRKNS